MSDFFSDMPPQLPLVMFASILVLIFIIPAMIFLMKSIMKNADKSKPLVSKRVKIIERRAPQGNGIALFNDYCVETDTGERLILRNFDERTIILKEGDQGIISYRGRTIESFKRGQETLYEKII